MHPSGGFELTKLTCTKLEDNLICHRGVLYITPDRISQRNFFLENDKLKFLNTHLMNKRRSPEIGQYTHGQDQVFEQHSFWF